MQIKPEVTSSTHTEQEYRELVRLLQESQERLQLIQQAANIGIFEWHIPTGTIAWTREAETLFGLQSGSFGGDFAAWERSVHPHDLAEARAKVFEAVAKGVNLDVQFRVVWPEDQSIHWIYAKGRTFYDQQGTPLRMIGTNIDITDRKRDEEELHAKDIKFRLFAESDIIGVMFFDALGKLTYANDAFLHLIGYSQEEFLAGKIFWKEITPPDWQDIDRQMVAKTEREGRPVLYERQFLHKDGSRIDAFVGFILLEGQSDLAMAFVLDMTERKHLERQKDDFIGVVSHELKTPVTSLKVFAQVLQKRFTRLGDHQNAVLLTKMEMQISKMIKLIEGLIDVTKVEGGKLQLHKTEFDLVLLVEEVIEEIQRTTAQHIILKEGLHYQVIWGDRDRIGQVLTNLLSNALKYSPHARTVLVNVSSDNAHVTVSVQDFGLGIPAEKQAQIFQRFYRVEEKNRETISGLGLGLYISAEMIKRHQGEMGFQSVPGHGSIFFFKLPLNTTRAI